MKTVSLELAKRLKEAGYPQEPGFRYCGGHDWYENPDDPEGRFEVCKNDALLGEDEYCETAGLTCEYFISSPTADEIIDQLPNGSTVRKELAGYVETATLLLIATPTADEVLDQLPKIINISGMDYFLDIFPDEEKDAWIVAYNYMRNNLGYKEYDHQEGGFLADVAARMWLYLKEQEEYGTI